ncbi:hypothetical protein T4A_83 [Trichinella pseudospiralis]|uniref:Uncharacterized protein n=1 Tax=Trichinella pseudospiralis TaxID=6337 RepID=A0A0V1DTW2_TRIPS|nr:hypothetical protein T4A_83 [Trichinella pseudospiralis]
MNGFGIGHSYFLSKFFQLFHFLALFSTKPLPFSSLLATVHVLCPKTRRQLCRNFSSLFAVNIPLLQFLLQPLVQFLFRSKANYTNNCAGVLPSLVPFFHSNYAPILNYNLDSSSRIFHYARLSAAAGLFIQSMSCFILSTLQPFTSQNDVLYRSLPPILNGKDVNGRKVEAVHWKNHLLPGQNCKNLYFQESSNKVQKAEAFFAARRLTDGKKRAQL